MCRIVHSLMPKIVALKQKGAIKKQKHTKNFVDK